MGQEQPEQILKNELEAAFVTKQKGGDAFHCSSKKRYAGYA